MEIKERDRVLIKTGEFRGYVYTVMNDIKKNDKVPPLIFLKENDKLILSLNNISEFRLWTLEDEGIYSNFKKLFSIINKNISILVEIVRYDKENNFIKKLLDAHKINIDLVKLYYDAFLFERKFPKETKEELNLLWKQENKSNKLYNNKSWTYDKNTPIYYKQKYSEAEIRNYVWFYSRERKHNAHCYLYGVTST